MPFKVFIILFPKSTLVALFITKNNSVILETYHQSNIEHIDVQDQDTKIRCQMYILCHVRRQPDTASNVRYQTV